MKTFREKTLKRMIKTRKEIKLLKKSAEIADSCIPVIEAALNEKGIREREIARRIRKQLKKMGAHEAFRTIVACGKRSAYVHPKPRVTNKVVSGIGLVDFGACYQGYRTDVTVPFIKGKISNREKNIVDSTLQAYNIAMRAVKLYEYCWRVHKKVDKFLRCRRLELMHAIGHGIGKSVHELPYIGNLEKKKIKQFSKKKRERIMRRWEALKQLKFQPGMVFTIEPAVYIRGIGGCRIENDFLMTNAGAKQLTHAKLVIVEDLNTQRF